MSQEEVADCHHKSNQHMQNGKRRKQFMGKSYLNHL